MKYLYKTLSPFESNGIKVMAQMHTDGTMLNIKIYTPTAGVSLAQGTVSYNGETVEFGISSENHNDITFPYDEAKKSAVITYGGIPHTCTWQGKINDLPPSASIEYTGVRAGDSIDFTFTYPLQITNSAHVGTEVYKKTSTGGWQLVDILSEKNTTGGYAYMFGYSWPTDSVFRFVLTFASYRTTSLSPSLNDYIGLTEYTLPDFTMTDDGKPLSPCKLTYSSVYSGQPITVTWEAPNDPLFDIELYVLSRSVNGGAWEEVYRDAETSFTDTTPVGARTISYSVSSFSDELYSTSTDGDTITLIQSNIYVGVNGVPRGTSAVYIGMNGGVTEIGNVAYVR